MATENTNTSESDLNVIGARIRTFIVTQIVRDPSATLDFQMPLRKAGFIDSLGLLDLLAFIETAFDLQLPDYFGDSPACLSVETLARYVATETSKHDG